MRVISISGGRSSAMMLKILIDNGLQHGDIVCFANTGREDEATLEFIHECEKRWEIPVVWLEYRKAKPKFEVVTYETASRKDNPRPFDELLNHPYLPNPTQRFCTGEMKVKTIKRFIRSRGHKGDIETFVGLRYDEQERVARKKAMNAEGKSAEYYHMPLYDLRVTIKERDAFWAAQPFDLRISSHSDNCDLCFLKGKWQNIRRIRENPEAVEWWIQAEKKAGLSAKRRRNAQFRKEYSYEELKHIALTQTTLTFPPEDRAISITCGCTD